MCRSLVLAEPETQSDCSVAFVPVSAPPRDRAERSDMPITESPARGLRVCGCRVSRSECLHEARGGDALTRGVWMWHLAFVIAAALANTAQAFASVLIAARQRQSHYSCDAQLLQTLMRSVAGADGAGVSKCHTLEKGPNIVHGKRQWCSSLSAGFSHWRHLA